MILFNFYLIQHDHNINDMIKRIDSEFNNSPAQSRKAAVVILKQSLGDDYDQ